MEVIQIQLPDVQFTWNFIGLIAFKISLFYVARFSCLNAMQKMPLAKKNSNFQPKTNNDSNIIMINNNDNDDNNNDTKDKYIFIDNLDYGILIIDELKYEFANINLFKFLGCPFLIKNKAFELNSKIFTCKYNDPNELKKFENNLENISNKKINDNNNDISNLKQNPNIKRSGSKASCNKFENNSDTNDIDYRKLCELNLILNEYDVFFGEKENIIIKKNDLDNNENNSNLNNISNFSNKNNIFKEKKSPDKIIIQKDLNAIYTFQKNNINYCSQLFPSLTSKKKHLLKHKYFLQILLEINELNENLPEELLLPIRSIVKDMNIIKQNNERFKKCDNKKKEEEVQSRMLLDTNNIIANNERKIPDNNYQLEKSS